MANSTKSTTFVVKSVKPGRKEGEKFYAEVGRLVMREGEKGLNGSLFLHMFGESFAVFPVEKREEATGQE
jgi:hypothetical protein